MCKCFPYVLHEKESKNNLSGFHWKHTENICTQMSIWWRSVQMFSLRFSCGIHRINMITCLEQSSICSYLFPRILALSICSKNWINMITCLEQYSICSYLFPGILALSKYVQPARFAFDLLIFIVNKWREVPTFNFFFQKQKMKKNMKNMKSN